MNRQQAWLEGRRSGTRLVVSHGSSFDDIQCVGALVKKQAIRTSLNGDAKEMVKLPKVLHCKFSLQGSNNGAYELDSGDSLTEHPM